MQRIGNRAWNEMRDIRLTYGIFEYAAGSVLLEIGKTKVLCAITLQTGVPPFLKGKRVGWLTAEYAMLPAATNVRTNRESEQGKRNGRSVEISRFIGRALRTVVNLDILGERTIIVDCDVLQADGSTRTACITAAGLALEHAQKQWLARRIIDEPIVTDAVFALSVGISRGNLLVDLNFQEDSSIDADFNIVLTKSGRFIEVQGAAERCSYSLQELVQVQELALDRAAWFFSYYCASGQNNNQSLTDSEKQSSPERSVQKAPVQQVFVPREEKVPLFSLKNRLSSGL